LEVCFLASASAQKKKTQVKRVKSKTIKTKDPAKKSGIEIKGILITALGVLLMIAFFRDNSIGAFGSAVKSFTFGIFGWPAYFVPSAIIIIGFLMIISNRGAKFFGLSSFYILMLFMIASAIIHTIYFNPANYVNQNPFILLARFYFEAQRLDGSGGGGGFLGALLAMPFLHIFKVIGARVILIAMLIIDVLLLTNVSAAAFLRGVGKSAGQGAKAIGNRYRTIVEHNRQNSVVKREAKAAAGQADAEANAAERITPAKGTAKAATNGAVKATADGMANISSGNGVSAKAASNGRTNGAASITILPGPEAGSGAGGDIDGETGFEMREDRVSGINFSGFNESEPDAILTNINHKNTFLAEHDISADGYADEPREMNGADEGEIVLYPNKSDSRKSRKREKKPPVSWSVADEGQESGVHARKFFSNARVQGIKTKSRKQDAGIIRAAVSAAVNQNNIGGWEKLDGAGGFSFTDDTADDIYSGINGEAAGGHSDGPAGVQANGLSIGIDDGLPAGPAVYHTEDTGWSSALKTGIKANTVVKAGLTDKNRIENGVENGVIRRPAGTVKNWAANPVIDRAGPNANGHRAALKTGAAKEPGAAKAPGGARAAAKPAPYRFPPLSYLDENPDKRKNMSAIKAQTQDTAIRLEQALLSFKVRAKVINVTRGPSVTLYELHPDTGVKVSAIVNLAEDISLKLGVTGIRIASVADRSAIGIEVPNKEVSMVYLRDIISSDEFVRHPSQLAFAVGVDLSGDAVIADIYNMPHLLIAGATGAGKSVCVNCLILSLLYKSSPDDVKLIMIDPKVVELSAYNGIPHLMIPVVTDPRKAAGALAWAVQEMLGRYNAFSEKKVKDLNGYNAHVKKYGGGEKLPRIVIIIDELADLMMAAPKEVQDSICRLAAMARAAGMHLVVATQRPTVDVITGLIKSNIPSRIAFRVASQTDSRVILDINGGEKLLGKGDMLFNPVGAKKPLRVQGAFISEAEMDRVIDYIKVTRDTDYDEEMIEVITSAAALSDDADAVGNDELLPQVIEFVVEKGKASTSMIQRSFNLGYSRAARIIDQMEARGIVSGLNGAKPRQILITKQQLYEMKF